MLTTRGRSWVNEGNFNKLKNCYARFPLFRVRCEPKMGVLEALCRGHGVAMEKLPENGGATIHDICNGYVIVLNM